MKNRIAVSTWSIHRLIGTSFANGPAVSAPFKKEDTWGPGEIDIFGVPAALAERGYEACELCHFHVGSLDSDYLEKLARSFDVAGVTLQTLLVDDGDITSAASRERDLAWIKQWIKASVTLRAQNVRVIAGKQKPSAETLSLSVDGLTRLLAYGDSVGAKVATENWFDLLLHLLKCTMCLTVFRGCVSWRIRETGRDLRNTQTCVRFLHGHSYAMQRQKWEKATMSMQVISMHVLVLHKLPVMPGR